MFFMDESDNQQAGQQTGDSCSSFKLSVKAVQRESSGNSSSHAIMWRNFLLDQAGQLNRRDN